jgi:hypothetical protein
MLRKPRSVGLLLSLALLLALHSQAHADTYELFQFTDYNGAGPVLGIDNAGDVLYRSPCADTTFNCYSVFQPFGMGYQTTTLPPFAYDDGVPCSTNSQAAFGLCSNGYEAYWISTATGSPLAGVYGGPNTDIQRFPSFDVADSPFFFLNSFGDIAWTAGTVEENYLAYDLTAHETPEPATFALLTTGLVFLAAIARRRSYRPFENHPR